MRGMAIAIHGEDDRGIRYPVNILTYTAKEPVGVVGDQSARGTGPLNQAVWKIAPVLATRLHGHP